MRTKMAPGPPSGGQVLRGGQAGEAKRESSSLLLPYLSHRWVRAGGSPGQALGKTQGHQHCVHRECRGKGWQKWDLVFSCC